MAQVLVRNLSQAALDRLKALARRKGRSLQAEMKAILEGASEADPASFRALAARLRARLAGRRHTDSAALISRDRTR